MSDLIDREAATAALERLRLDWPRYTVNERRQAYEMAISDAQLAIHALPAAVPPYRIKGGDGTHWEGCYKTHADCADALIDELRAEVELLKGEIKALEDGTGVTNSIEQVEAQLKVEREARERAEAVPVVDLEKEAKLRDALDTLVTLAPTRHQIERLGALEPDAIVGEAEAYALEWMLAVDAAKRLLTATEGK